MSRLRGVDDPLRDVAYTERRCVLECAQRVGAVYFPSVEHSYVVVSVHADPRHPRYPITDALARAILAVVLLESDPLAEDDALAAAKSDARAVIAAYPGIETLRLAGDPLFADL